MEHNYAHLHNMLNSKICRICLAANVQLYKMNNTPLQEIYEKLTCSPLSSTDSTPDTVCYLCVARLKNFWNLKELATQANRLLTEILENGLRIDQSTLYKELDCNHHLLSITVLESVDITKNSSIVAEKVDVKSEEGIDNLKKEGLQDELCEDIQEAQNNLDIDNNEQFEADDFKQESDSEDDLPLKNFSDVKDEKTGRRKRKYNKETKLDAVEIILTREQQMNELLERSKSLNYLNSPYKCDYCYKGFIHPHAYENHKEKHSKSNGDLECPVCHLRYSSVRQLNAHIATAHERRYACNRCPHQSHTKNQALAHEKWHNGYTYPCNLCGEKFSKPTSYFTHMSKSHACSHVCAECGHSFLSRHGLLMHVSKTHRGNAQKKPDESSEPADKRYCADCGIQFNSLDAWQRHIVTSVKHDLWKNGAECVICNACVPPGLRRAHERAHARAAAPRPPPPAPAPPAAALPCAQCDSRFKTRLRLQAHVKRMHLGVKYNKNIVCEVCGKKCTSESTLRYHQRRHTGERPFACARCGARFAGGQQLRLHARVHSGERPYACAHCAKRFTQKTALNRHYRVHTGVKPYECHLCSKSFSQSNSVKLHVNSVHLKMVPQKKRTKVPTDAVKQETT